MKKLLRNMVLGGTLLAGTLAGSAKADDIRLTYGSPETGIGGTSSVLNTDYDFASLTKGYEEGIDSLLKDGPTNPNDKLNIVYQPGTDTSNNPAEMSFNYALPPQIGDTYTFNLSAEDRTGLGFSSENYVDFYSLSFNNPSGVTDYQYSLAVDTDADGVNDYFESGNVLERVTNHNSQTDSWMQTVPAGFDWRNGDVYGGLTLTAVPEPATMSLLGLGALGMLYKRK